jgi:hypothetical protein
MMIAAGYWMDPSQELLELDQITRAILSGQGWPEEAVASLMAERNSAYYCQAAKGAELVRQALAVPAATSPAEGDLPAQDWTVEVRPDLGAPSREPSVYDLVSSYYLRHVSVQQAEEWTPLYCKALREAVANFPSA